jgi:hypothetical protein
LSKSSIFYGSRQIHSIRFVPPLGAKATGIPENNLDDGIDDGRLKFP